MAVATRIEEGPDWKETATGAVVSGTIKSGLPGWPIGVYTGLKDAVSGDEVLYARSGIWEFPAKSADVIAKGDKLYWDNTAKELTKTATANTYAGVATAAAGSGVTKVNVALNQGTMT